MTAKPIETIYKGHRFRSRLEARWAVAFDHLGITWQYEPQGFEVGGGTVPKRRYLPDFHLPYADLWVEVKGDKTRLDWELMAAAVDPGGGATLPDSRHAYGGFGSAGSAVLILGNIPPEPAIHILVINRKSAFAEQITLADVEHLNADGTAHHEMQTEATRWVPVSCFADPAAAGADYAGRSAPIGWRDLTAPLDRWSWTERWRPGHPERVASPPDIDGDYRGGMLGYWLDDPHGQKCTARAYQAARQARFEWGEAG